MRDKKGAPRKDTTKGDPEQERPPKKGKQPRNEDKKDKKDKKDDTEQGRPPKNDDTDDTEQERPPKSAKRSPALQAVSESDLSVGDGFGD